jgi:nitrous oxidase accessory protein NosD
MVSTGYGLYIRTNSNEIFKNNIIESSTGYGVLIYSGMYNNLTSNNVSSLQSTSYVLFVDSPTQGDNHIDQSNLAEGKLLTLL